MAQLYRAIDSVDGVYSYFYFDGKGMQTVLPTFVVGSDNEAINHFQSKGSVGDWLYREATLSRMINAVLLAEW